MDSKNKSHLTVMTITLVNKLSTLQLKTIIYFLTVFLGQIIQDLSQDCNQGVSLI